LTKQQEEFNTHQTTYKQKETDLKTTKVKYDQTVLTHTQKTSEYDQASLKLKTIATEKEDLKHKTTLQQQEHDEVERKNKTLEEELAVVTASKRALVVTYNETIVHVKEVHDKVVKVQNDIASKRQDLANGNTDHTKLFRELNDLRARHAALTQAEHDHAAGAAQLAEKEAKEKAELEALKAEEEKEKAEIEALKVELAEVQAKIESVSTTVVTYKTEVDKFVEGVRVARDTHGVKQVKLSDSKVAHNKLKTYHVDALSKHQSLQKRIAQLELKVSHLNKEEGNTEAKLNALAALEAEERNLIDKSQQDITELEGQVATQRGELQNIQQQISVKEKEIEDHKVSHKTVTAEYQTKIGGVVAQISTKDSFLGQLKALIDHSKSVIKETLNIVAAKKAGTHESHHHTIVIEYSTSEDD